MVLEVILRMIDDDDRLEPPLSTNNTWVHVFSESEFHMNATSLRHDLGCKYAITDICMLNVYIYTYINIIVCVFVQFWIVVLSRRPDNDPCVYIIDVTF